jgi:hypothetical protein
MKKKEKNKMRLLLEYRKRRVREQIVSLEAQELSWKRLVGKGETNSYAVERYGEIVGQLAALKERLHVLKLVSGETCEINKRYACATVGLKAQQSDK